MGDEFDAALAKTEYANAIRSFDQAVVNGDRMRVQRDEALATISRVWALADMWDMEGSFKIWRDKAGQLVKEALEPAQSEAQQAASATNGRKGPELRPCDSKPAAGLTGGTP